MEAWAAPASTWDWKPATGRGGASPERPHGHAKELNFPSGLRGHRF